VCNTEGGAFLQPPVVGSLIVPPKALDQLSKVLGGGKSEVTIRIGRNFAEFRSNGTSLTTKLIEGEYPDYQQVIPTKSTKKATIKRDELFAAIRRISVMSNSKTRQIRFFFEKNNLLMSTSDRDFNGEGQSKLSVVYEKDPLTIGFNADFLIDILRLIDDDEVSISMNSALSAALISPVDKKKSEKVLFLIMPLRLIDEVDD